MVKRVLRPIGVKNQLTIPPWILKEVGVCAGDYLELLPRKKEHGFLVRLVRPIPVAEEDYTEEDLLALRRLVDDQLSKGEYTKYDTPEKAMEHCQQLITERSKKGKR